MVTLIMMPYWRRAGGLGGKFGGLRVPVLWTASRGVNGELRVRRPCGLRRDLRVGNLRGTDVETGAGRPWDGGSNVGGFSQFLNMMVDCN